PRRRRGAARFGRSGRSGCRHLHRERLDRSDDARSRRLGGAISGHGLLLPGAAEPSGERPGVRLLVGARQARRSVGRLQVRAPSGGGGDGTRAPGRCVVRARPPGGRLGAALLPAILILLPGAARADDGGASTPPGPAAPKGPVETVEVRDSAGEMTVMDTTAFATVIRAEDFADRITS